MSHTQQSLDAAVIALSNKTTVTGSVGATAAYAAVKTGVLGVGVTDICALAGVGIAFLGFSVSSYFQWRRDRREHQEHLKRIGKK